MNSKMEEPLTYEDIGHLLEAKGKKLAAGEGDPEETLRDVVETLARSKRVTAREKSVDANGRVSVGRGLAGIHGVTLFHPDPEGTDD